MHGLYVIWWVQQQHLPVPLVAAVLAAGDLALIVIEVPTGWLADRVGHRRSLIAGSAVQVAGMLVCWLGHGLWALVASTLLIAAGDGFRSGAHQALVYGSCHALDRERDFQALTARAHAVETLALVALTLLGGAIVTRWGFAAGWLAETTLCAVGLLLAALMTEPPREAADPDPADRSARVAVGLFLLMVPTAALGAAAAAGSFLVQTAVSASPAATAAFVAAFALCEAAGAAIASRLALLGRRGHLSLLVAGTVLTGAALLVPALLLPAVGVVWLLAGLAEPMRDAALQAAVPDTMRARVASVASACDMALSVLLLPLAGWTRR